MQRDKLSDEERRLQKQLKDAMKELPVTMEESKKSWKSALDAVKTRLKNQIKDLQHQIETGEKTPKKKGVEYDAEAEALVQQRDELKDLLKNIEGKTELSDEQKTRIAIRAIERSIDEYERRISEKDFSAMKQPSKAPVTEKLSEARKRLDDLKDTYQKMKDAAGVTEKMRLERLKDNLNKRIDDYKRRLKEKDYSVKKRKPQPEFDMEAARLEM